jgi:hypothetical protein
LRGRGFSTPRRSPNGADVGESGPGLLIGPGIGGLLFGPGIGGLLIGPGLLLGLGVIEMGLLIGPGLLLGLGVIGIGLLFEPGFGVLFGFIIFKCCVFGEIRMVDLGSSSFPTFGKTLQEAKFGLVL